MALTLRLSVGGAHETVVVSSACSCFFVLQRSIMNGIGAMNKTLQHFCGICDNVFVNPSQNCTKRLICYKTSQI